MIKEFLRKSREKYLLPIRKQIYDLIEENSRVVDLGCGDGELLRILSPKIEYGLGIDKDEKKIRFAKELIEKAGIENLKFRVQDAGKKLEEKFDYSILMFVLHSLDYNSQNKIFDNAKRNSKKIIIVDYKIPLENKLFVYFDELIAGHYKNFSNFKQGGIAKIISQYERLDTKRRETGIWIIN